MPKYKFNVLFESNDFGICDVTVEDLFLNSDEFHELNIQNLSIVWLNEEDVLEEAELHKLAKNVEAEDPLLDDLLF